ncbi:ABC transporter ATP-binding protein [Desulfuribacillus alkaliarsenatis]|uniref:ABC transporter ATP-binding protein n=2 Tax=Desulfuribacillus alkaliarsenatis TaxID=766136 RepID=A0A1E5G2I5_9FIRM|nr:ABC transporter ATP-binding protein [Desulfuribacillus alkaliarsenatis]
MNKIVEENNIIEVKNVHKSYGSGSAATHALRGIDLKINSGTFNCIVGPSGHGKSTLLQIIGGLDKPTSGQVNVMGEQINALSDQKLANFRSLKLGFVFQFFNLLKGLTVLENIQIPLMFAKIPAKQQEQRAKELLQLVDLSEKAQAKAFELSGGQKQRVAIARALANNPELLLMDEPTGNLDSESEAEVLKIIHELHRNGKTIVMVTHSKEIADQGERIITIKDGMVCE